MPAAKGSARSPLGPIQFEDFEQWPLVEMVFMAGQTLCTTVTPFLIEELCWLGINQLPLIDQNSRRKIPSFPSISPSPEIYERVAYKGLLT